jgi:hypothetical protein
LSIWSWLWIAWLAIFATLETIALRDKDPDDTFSEFVWRTLRIRDRRPTALTWAARVALIIGGTWLTGHLAFGWWTL